MSPRQAGERESIRFGSIPVPIETGRRFSRDVEADRDPFGIVAGVRGDDGAGAIGESPLELAIDRANRINDRDARRRMLAFERQQRQMRLHDISELTRHLLRGTMPWSVVRERQTDATRDLAARASTLSVRWRTRAAPEATRLQRASMHELTRPQPIEAEQ